MSISSEIQAFEQLAVHVGPGAALKLCAFFGGLGKSLYIPHKPIAGHAVEKVIGAEPWRRLVLAHGDTSLSIPKVELMPLRRAGLVYALGRHGVPIGLQASAAGCTKTRISQLRQQLRLEGFDQSLLDAGDDDDDGDRAPHG